MLTPLAVLGLPEWVAREMRQNAGLSVGSQAVFAIIAPQQERWRGFRPKNRWQTAGDEDYHPLWTGETVGYLGNVGIMALMRH